MDMDDLMQVDWTNLEEVRVIALLHAPCAVVWNDDEKSYNIISASRVGDDSRAVVYLAATIH